jgi:hypothetical protein
LDHANKVRTSIWWIPFGHQACQNTIYCRQIYPGAWMSA